MVFLLMGGAYLRSRIKQAGKWDQETIVSFFLCQYCSGEYLRLGLLSLSREYPPSRVEACCQLANREGLVRLKQLKSVLTSGRDQLPASPLSYPELPQEHENIRGPQSFH